MKITFRQDLVGSVVFLVVSITLWLLIPYQILIEDEEEIITAQTFPRLIIGLMGICSAILLVKELIKYFRKQPVKMVELNFQQEGRALTVVVLLVAYWGILHWLPFMLSSILFSVLLLLFFNCRNWKYYAIVISIVVSVSIFFQHFLNVSLP
ncbi:tripartite tricarboxylate transporter TctB family protein [[Haemophilus] felis]|uniref:Tricarboxylate transporter n=1 Tax=[Haemophilus] felis TaxID=123822 RepID=A0A1T0AYL1_9PAST|nr:tripartite tricarboxylate transporter TctB family protein [[Haemophilus] felis]NBI40541.1 tripartite tricarboxylate transporter TctB family protein [[Haemophilus] felis]NBI42426.1 tripartite tricarboxylate transporter TctB family protein [[Haemophilus] felis]OOS02551.1 tricarboxylate transporter [[Haemophilus] felis]